MLTAGMAARELAGRSVDFGAKESADKPTEPTAMQIFATNLTEIKDRLALTVDQQRGLISRLGGPTPVQTEDPNKRPMRPGSIGEVTDLLEIINDLSIQAFQNQHELRRFG